jgi:transcriptional regulator with XRE-family HTH domain
MTLSERLVFARKQIGMTQEKLAKSTGIQIAQICKFETGKRSPDISNFRKIAIALRVSADYLLEIDIKELWGMNGMSISTLQNEMLKSVGTRVCPTEWFVIEMDECERKHKQSRTPFIVESGFDDTLFRKQYGNYKTHGHFEQENWAVKKAIALEDEWERQNE